MSSNFVIATITSQPKNQITKTPKHQNTKSQPGIDLVVRQYVFEVVDDAVFGGPVADSGVGEFSEFVVGDGQGYGVVGGLFGLGDQVEAVFLSCFLGVGPGVVDVDFEVVVLQRLDDVDDSGVSEVRAVFLEGEAQDEDFCAGAVDALLCHQFDQFAGDVGAHAVVGAAAGQDHLGVEADVLGLVGQVVRVHADAVAADQTGAERQEVPLGAGGFEYRAGVQAQLAEQHGQFVDQTDIHVALGVFDDFCRLGDPDILRFVRSRRNDRGVESVNEISSLGGGAGGYFFYCWEAVFAVARIYSFGAVAGEELFFGFLVFWFFRFNLLAFGLAGFESALQIRFALEDGDAVFFGAAGVDRGFVDDYVSGLKELAYGFACRDQRP